VPPTLARPAWTRTANPWWWARMTITDVQTAGLSRVLRAAPAGSRRRHPLAGAVAGPPHIPIHRPHIPALPVPSAAPGHQRRRLTVTGRYSTAGGPPSACPVPLPTSPAFATPGATDPHLRPPRRRAHWPPGVAAERRRRRATRTRLGPTGTQPRRRPPGDRHAQHPTPHPPGPSAAAARCPRSKLQSPAARRRRRHRGPTTARDPVRALRPSRTTERNDPHGTPTAPDGDVRGVGRLPDR